MSPDSLLLFKIAAAAAVWLVLWTVLRQTVRWMRKRQAPDGGRLRALLIKVDAISFLVRWGLAILFVTYIGYAVLQWGIVRYPSFYVQHLPTITRWYRHFKVSAFTIVCAITLVKLSRLIGESILSHTLRGGIREERERRARTLLSVLNGFITTVIVVITAIMLLAEFGQATTPLLTGAGLAGLAVAFSAQTLLKDFFTGFFIILEDQYKIGDIVRIGDRTGEVEHMSLRITTLRDEDGSLHVVPNGEIKVVSNLTSGWAQANLDIPLPFMYDPEQVRSIMEEVSGTFAQDEQFKKQLLAAPRVVGLNDVSAANSVYRVSLRTVPGAQARAVQELRRRIIARFAEKGIRYGAMPA